MASIKRPGVEVTQENVTAQATVVAPSLTSVIVGACKQVVSAFNDSGVAPSEAGTYQDGKGTVSYAMPSIKTGAVVDTDTVRVFRVDGAGASTELSNGSSETTVLSGSTGAYNGTTGFTDTAGTFLSAGAQKGDFIRFTYRAETVDLEITAAVAANDEVVVANTIDQTDAIAGISYTVVRNPAQFVFKSAAEQADVEIGDITDPETNYLHVAIKSTAASTLTGAAGDSFSMQIKESDAAYTATHTATGTAVATGTNIGAHFNTLNSAYGPASTTTLGAGAYLLIHKSSATPIGGTALAAAVRSNTVAGTGEADTIVMTAANSMASKHAVVGKILTRLTADGAVYDHTTGKATIASHGITAQNVTDEVAYVFIDDATNGGLYKVTTRTDANELVLDAAARPSGTVTFAGGASSGQQICSLLVANSSPAVTLSVGVTTIVYDYAATSTAYTVLGGSPSGKAIVFGSDAKASAAYNTISAVSASGRQITVTDLASGGSPSGTAVVGGASGRQSQVVTASFATNFVVPSSGSTYQIELLRDAKGMTTITGADLKDDLDAITAFSDSFSATVGGSPTFTYAECDATRVGQTVAGVHPFDGGVDANNLLLDADLIGSTTATHSIYVSYQALRTDVSDQAASPALVSISSSTDVTTYLGTISADNPLAMAAYLATLQSPSTTFKCLGVSATSASEASGTTAAWTSALAFLEGQDVYSVALLSNDPAHQALLSAHVTSMSSASNKSERIGFVSQAMPSYSNATLLSSGTAGNTGATFKDDSDPTFTTNVDFSLNAALTAVLGTGDDDLILVVAAKSDSDSADSKANGVLPVKYGIKVDKTKTNTAHSTDPSQLVLQTGASTGANYSTAWNSLVDVTWSLYQMGTALATTAAKATAVAGLGAQFANKRMFLVWPDTAAASISGAATSMGGEFLAAAWAAKVGYEKPGVPFTNRTLTGFSSVTNSNGLFSKAQLDEIAGGGTFITVQDSPSAALSCRHQLSTKVDTIQNRELSITKTVDYVAKQLRDVLEPKIGSYLITQSYLDSLGVIVEGVLTNFIEAGTLTGGSVNFIEIDSTSSDTVNIQVIISVPFPANYIALTLQF